ncbi:MAG: response regulator transcription factor [Chitinophagaceae bacterium]|nr:response regulator transcription factor [Chitinophagaceae bacterium]
MRYRLAIVDDKPNVIAAVCKDLIYSDRVEIVFTADNGAEFIEKLQSIPHEKHPQVVLMDIDMPVMNGIDAVRAASGLYSHIQYIMLTVFDDDDKLFEALKAGAHGYLLKEERTEAILRAIEEIIEKKGAPMSPRIARKTLNLLLQEPGAPAKNAVVPESGLSERETEILRNMVSGLDYKKIGEKLFISPNTVRNHISKIYDKLHISSKTDAVKLAIRNRWV